MKVRSKIIKPTILVGGLFLLVAPDAIEELLE
ncbi:hypothetical protein ES703_56192 [subsurface metagenome]